MAKRVGTSPSNFVKGLIGLLIIPITFLMGTVIPKRMLVQGEIPPGEVSKDSFTEQDFQNIINAHTRWLQDPKDPEGQQANLSFWDVTNRNLEGVQLPRAILTGITLDFSNLTEANFVQARVGKSSLKQAILVRANLQHTFFRQASLTGANLQEANLQSSGLDKTNLSLAKLDKANLSNANLYQANLNNASLTNAILHQTNLKLANFQGANLERADLRGANLFRTNFSKANLRETNFEGTLAFGGTDLSRTIGLTQSQIDMACIDEKTKLPKNMLRPNPCHDPDDK